LNNNVTASTQLSGRRLLIARVVWVTLVLLMLGLWAVGIATLIREPLPDCSQVPCDPFDLNAGDLAIARELSLPTGILGGMFTFAASISSGLFNFVIAGIIFWRKSDDWMGLLVSYLLVYLGAVLITSSDDALLRAYPETGLLSELLFIPGLILLFVLFFVFPDGRFIPRKSKWLLLLLITGMVIFNHLSDARDLSEQLFVFSFLVLVAIAVSSQLYRYVRVSRPTERQQTKWVLLGLMGTVSLAIVWIGLRELYPPDQPSASRIYALFVAVPLILFLGLLLPLSLAISILRYRLWDIEVIANRTLVYGVLTGVLVLVYFGSIVLLQGLFRALTGQESPLAVVFSTLVIAALFAPLRRRIQRVIDRRFFRRKYDAERVLAEFAIVARDEVSLDNLAAELQRVAEETMQPTHVSLWINRID
jgi:hypothetical protein